MKKVPFILAAWAYGICILVDVSPKELYEDFKPMIRHPWTWGR